MAIDEKVTSSVRENSGSKSVSDKLNEVYQMSPSGSVDTAIGDSFYGINHRQQPGAISVNKDYFGLTLFTRPQLNLTTENLRSVRSMSPLLTNQPDSIQRIIRCLLDPALGSPNPKFGTTAISSPLVDNQQAFIPILSNHLQSISGWPDMEAGTYSSPGGVMNESFGIIDSNVENYREFTITANFRNLPGDPITTLFMYWLRYASHAYLGNIVPYPENLINHRIDYNTRIYRLVLDERKRKVQKIAACGAAMPVNAPIGAAFNYEADRPINNSNDQVSVSFNCFGAMYLDDILVDEFNRTAYALNRSLRPETRDQYFVEIQMHELPIFNNRGYPQIDEETYELKWFVTKAMYNSYVPNLERFKANNPQYNPIRPM